MHDFVFELHTLIGDDLWVVTNCSYFGNTNSYSSRDRSPLRRSSSSSYRDREYRDRDYDRDRDRDRARDIDRDRDRDRDSYRDRPYDRYHHSYSSSRSDDDRREYGKNSPSHGYERTSSSYGSSSSPHHTSRSHTPGPLTTSASAIPHSLTDSNGSGRSTPQTLSTSQNIQSTATPQVSERTSAIYRHLPSRNIDHVSQPASSITPYIKGVLQVDVSCDEETKQLAAETFAQFLRAEAALAEVRFYLVFIPIKVTYLIIIILQASPTSSAATSRRRSPSASGTRPPSRHSLL
jgi:hypothetical protein